MKGNKFIVEYSTKDIMKKLDQIDNKIETHFVKNINEHNRLAKKSNYNFYLASSALSVALFAIGIILKIIIR